MWTLIFLSIGAIWTNSMLVVLLFASELLESTDVKGDYDSDGFVRATAPKR